MFAFSGLVLTITNVRMTKILLGLVMLVGGILIQAGGLQLSLLTHNVTYTLLNASAGSPTATVSFVIFLMMTFGAILVMIAAIRGEGDDEE